jgi:hypothetical protein
MLFLSFFIFIFININLYKIGDHKVEGMENVLIHKCEFGTCNKTATNCKENTVESGENIMIRYCKKHKLESEGIKKVSTREKVIKEKVIKEKIIKEKTIKEKNNISVNICKYENEEGGQDCTSSATYSFKADKVPLFCFKHKLSNMEYKISSKTCK